MISTAGSAAERWVQEGDPPSKQAILRAALKLFVERGYEPTSIREIAREAGYTNPALFKFFRSKEDLGVYLFEHAYRELMTAFAGRLHHVEPVERVLGEWADAYVGLLAERQDALLYVHDHLALFWPRVAERFGGRSLFSLMRGWIERGRERGSLCTDVPIEVQIASVSGLFHQLATMVQLGEIPAGDVVGLRDAVARTLVRLLAPTAERRAAP